MACRTELRSSVFAERSPVAAADRRLLIAPGHCFSKALVGDEESLILEDRPAKSGQTGSASDRVAVGR